MKSYPNNYLQINTKFRTNPNDNTNNCRIELPDKLQKGNWRLVHFLFPNTSFTVNDNNNKITIRESILSNQPITCIIEKGFYTYDSLPYAVIKALNDAGQLNEGYTLHLQTYSSISKLYLIIN